MKQYPPFCLRVALAFLGLLLSSASFAQSTVIYQDDFEGAVSGWTINNTDFDPDVTTFLGRFDNSPTSTSRTFAIPPSTARVDIVFDFYRFDSWDNTARFGFDRFQVDIDGTQIFSLPFPNPQATRSGTLGNVDWSHVPTTGRVELAFNTGEFWFDQLHRFTISVENPGATLDLTLRCAINQGGNDESCGFDNMSVIAFPTLPEIEAQKEVATVGGDFAIPGNLVDYTISVNNTGGTLDAGSLVIVDPIPSDLTIFTGDLDGSGNSVLFLDSSTPGSGLSCCNSANIEYSISTSSPPIFGYVPTSDYDPAITHLRITPSGTMRDAQIDPVDVAFVFRARIN
jgi:uncharacterized repeat protein (TIGR01451 family)